MFKFIARPLRQPLKDILIEGLVTKFEVRLRLPWKAGQVYDWPDRSFFIETMGVVFVTSVHSSPSLFIVANE